MPIVGTLLKKGITLRESLEQQYTSAAELQKAELRKLLIHSQNTLIGRKYGFKDILSKFKDKEINSYYQHFASQIPVFDYDKIHNEFWKLSEEGIKDVCYPGKIKYFALSSGTSGASSKYIPITKDMLKSIRRTSVRQILSLSKCNLPDSFFTKGILMLGGSTDLRRNGTYFDGDLSGITTAQLPFWFQHFYKPGKKIAKNTDWSAKLDEITKKAKDWDIGIIVGVPAWLQILLEKIVNYYHVKDIHEIWPNLEIFVHGGVAFEPYKHGFAKLLGRPLIYLETYLASEGFIAFQSASDGNSLRLVLNNGIFYEFVPFNNENFTEEGELRDRPNTLSIAEVKEKTPYAILLTTNAGAWRYLIGDIIQFTSITNNEIIITGRTKHFLSLCGEHLSVDNMNQAINSVGLSSGVDIREFTVIGEVLEAGFGHHWFIGSDDKINTVEFSEQLDEKLKVLNDDYAVERKHALKEITVTVLPTHCFYDWMRQKGKEGGQNKFPRVLKNEKSKDWLRFVTNQVNLNNV